MVAGRVVRFDGARGYGFIAPDHGGEDVFLHVNDMLIPEAYVRSGLAVEFEVEDGDRGLKALAVRLAKGPDGNPLTPPLMAAPAAAPAVSRQVDGEDPMCDVLTAEECTTDVTELLLRAAPALTGEQIVRIRRELVQFAKSHGWVEG
ncbi:cold-shock protein [Peterkaempfera griseoplana]|uniref:cold-shock protein n=1 Tax=Peterkaempfera griseoplana TaxID=66896 RepID=UPI0006E2B5E2|nr:cold shock domain-containing protein [Peterkaempfera griseoplana]